MNKSLTITLVLSICFGFVAMAEAKTFKIASYPESTGQKLIESASDPRALKRELQKIVPEFKVPAQSKIRCQLDPSAIVCGEVYGEKVCPEQIEVRVPGQNRPVTLDVDCIGPDARGECECEVTGN